jgi:hypothetical protein
MKEQKSAETETYDVRHIADDTSFATSVDKHFLADRLLTKQKVTSLLLSASFGANSILYAVFLGYLMGVWALLIQLAWMSSFYLLARFAPRIHASLSLHEFLGQYFGSATQRIAALCSIIGITYFVGWEIAVASSSLQPSIGLNGAGSQNLSILLVVGIIAAISYSVIWGRRASGSVNVFLNSVKILCLVVLAVVLFYSAMPNISLNMFFPPFGDAIAAVGIIGFITNVLFNLSWQFVDNSSWQSIISMRSENSRSLKSAITVAGLGTLLTVNGIGTLLGTLLRSVSDVDSSNALGQIVHASSLAPTVAAIAMAILIIFSAMSLFDGAILSVSQSIVVDLGIKSRAVATLRYARVVTLLVGIIAAIIVDKTIQLLGGSIFDFVYIVIVVQLTLIGPVLAGLLYPRQVKKMWIAIVASLVVGVGMAVIGTIQNNQDMIQFAGLVTVIVSIAVSMILIKITLK